MAITIRRADDYDVEQVLELSKELKRSGYKEMGMKNITIKESEGARQLYTEALNRNDVLILIAEDNKKTWGMAIAYLTPRIIDGEYRMLIEEMVVKPEARGRGVGAKLLEAMEQKAKGRGVKVIKVTTGTKLKANEFYKKHGYAHFENAYRKKI